MDVAAAADELYGLLPDQFTARRGELAAQARAAGDGSARTEITALRKPTVAAWLVNMVVRERGDEVQQLLDIAAELRTAQRGLDAEQMRALSDQRRSAIAVLTRAARDLARDAGRPASESVLRDVQASFDAAVADENAERALRTGRLTTALSYSGFGEVDISDAVAALDARPRLEVIRGEKAGPARGVAKAAAGRQEARNEARNQARNQAREKLDEATRHRDELLAEAEQIRRRLADLERALKPADAAVRAAQRRVDAASS